MYIKAIDSLERIVRETKTRWTFPGKYDIFNENNAMHSIFRSMLHCQILIPECFGILLKVYSEMNSNILKCCIKVYDPLERIIRETKTRWTGNMIFSAKTTRCIAYLVVCFAAKSWCRNAVAFCFIQRWEVMSKFYVEAFDPLERLIRETKMRWASPGNSSFQRKQRDA